MKTAKRILDLFVGIVLILGVASASPAAVCQEGKGDFDLIVEASPDPVRIGEELTVRTTLTNKGECTDEYTVDGRTVKLEAGESKTRSITRIVPDTVRPGSYSLKIVVRSVYGKIEETWTFPVNVTTNNPPDTPTAVSPADRDILETAYLVTLQASHYSDPDDDDHIQTHWLVRRADSVYHRGDYDPSFDTVVTVGEGDLSTHTISGIVARMKYVWKVGYVDSLSKAPSWSGEYCFTVGISTSDSNVQIEPGTEVFDYKIISVVQWPEDALCTSVFGLDYRTSNFRIGTYDAMTSSYTECGGHLVIEPGRGYWFLARNGLNPTIDGILVSTEEDIEVGLNYNADTEDGWNMIASPNANYDWGDVQVVEYDGAGNILNGPWAISDTEHPVDTLIDTSIWEWINGPYASYGPDDSFVMQAYEGYWVKAKKANVYLVFTESAQTEVSSTSMRPASIKATANPADSPPMPMGDFKDSKGSRGSSGEVGSGGCLIDSASASIGW